MTLRERFEKKVSAVSAGGCRLWTAAVNRSGYGCVWRGGKMLLAHRVAWELVHGPVPKGLCVLHRCDTPGCVVVDHLFLGSNLDNMKDMASKGRAWNPRAAANAKKSHCSKGHPYSGSNLHVLKNGHRQCKACGRASLARYRAAIGAEEI